MKLKNLFFLVFVACLVTACNDKVNPVVDTLYLKDGDRESERQDAIPKLLEHYTKSAKDKEFYEVISEEDGRFILNYYPSGKLLTLCGDPGSGWSRQFKDVDESTLQMLVAAKVSFDDIDGIGLPDSQHNGLLTLNDPFFTGIKTNGHPSI